MTIFQRRLCDLQRLGILKGQPPMFSRDFHQNLSAKVKGGNGEFLGCFFLANKSSSTFKFIVLLPKHQFAKTWKSVDSI